MLKEKKKRTKKAGINILQKDKMNSQFDYIEVYRHIRTNIEYSTMDKELKSISITSTQAGEAKTTTSMNLAFIFAAKHEKVLLIDADLRKQTLHRYMKLSNKTGLTNALMDFQKTRTIYPDYMQTIKDSSFAGKLSILTAGISVPNPSEILGSQLFKDYINALKEIYDFIIIDCAPVGSISDAIPVGNATDGTIFVVSSQDTNRKDAAACVNLLQRNNVNVLGSILTKADTEMSSYKYYYY